MNVLYFDIDALGAPYGGGQARRTFEIAKRVARNHHVTVVTAGHKSLKPETVEGVRYERMLPLPFPANFMWYFAEILPRGLLSHADIVVESFSTPLTASLLSGFRRGPVIGTANFLFSVQMSEKYHLPFDRWAAFALSKFRYVVALSDFQRAYLETLAPGARIEVIPNGCDAAALRHRWNGSGRYVAFLGRIDAEQKGIDLLLDAAELLPDGIPLRIAGGGPASEWLAREIARRDLRAKVEIVGTLRGDDRHAFLANAAAMALPSRYEGQSLVLLDAITIGVPVVAFGIPANVEVLRGCGALVPPFDTTAFAWELADVCTNDERQRYYSTASRLASVKYRWDSAAAAEERFYSTALALSREAAR